MNESKTDKKDKIVYLGLGSNIDPTKNINTALHKLDSNFILYDTSCVYESPSIGRVGPDFLNLIVAIKTNLPFDKLKHKLRYIESSMGRVRSEDKNAPRPIDIDILIYADEVLDEEVWILPHLAIPLSEVYPSLFNLETGSALQDIADDLFRKNEIIRRDDVVSKNLLTIKSA